MKGFGLDKEYGEDDTQAIISKSLKVKQHFVLIHDTPMYTCSDPQRHTQTPHLQPAPKKVVAKPATASVAAAPQKPTEKVDKQAEKIEKPTEKVEKAVEKSNTKKTAAALSHEAETEAVTG